MRRKGRKAKKVNITKKEMKMEKNMKDKNMVKRESMMKIKKWKRE